MKMAEERNQYAYQTLALQQAQKQYDDEQFLTGKLGDYGGDVSKTLNDTEVQKRVPMWVAQQRYALQQQGQATTKFNWEMADAAEKERDRRLGDARKQLVGLQDLSNEADISDPTLRSNAQTALNILRTDPSKLDTIRQTIGQQEFQGDPEADHLLSTIGDAKDGKDAADRIEKALVSPRAKAYRDLIRGDIGYGSPLIPGEDSTRFSAKTAMHLPDEYDEGAVTAALAGSPEQKAYDEEQASKASTAKTQGEAPADVETKWNAVLATEGAGVTDPASLSALRKRMIDAKAPASVINRIPTTYDPKSWKAFMDSTLTEQEREKRTEDAETKRAHLATEGLLGGGFSSDPNAFEPRPPDPAKANQQDPVTGVSYAARYEGAKTWALTGQNTYPSRGISQAQVRASAQYNASVGTALANMAGVDIATLRQQFQGQSRAVNQIVPQITSMGTLKRTAEDNLQSAIQESASLPRTDSPYLNGLLQKYISGGPNALAGNPEYSRFVQLVYDGAVQYARMVSGGAQSSAQLNATAATKATELINAAQSPASFAASIGAMRVAMDHQFSEATNTLARVNNVSPEVARFLQVAATGEPLQGMQPQAGPQDGQTGIVNGQRAIYHANGPQGPGWYAQ